MTIIATVPSDMYQGSGWAVAAIVNRQVVAVRYIDSAQGRMPTVGELQAAYSAIKSLPATIAAERAADEAWDALEAAETAGSDTTALDARFHERAVVIRDGMMSGTEFCHTLSKSELRHVAINYARDR